MSSIQPEQKLAWYDAIGKWRQHATQFSNDYQKLLSQRTYVSARPKLYAEWLKMVASGKNTQVKVLKINNDLKRVVNFFNSETQMASNVVNAIENTAGNAWHSFTNYFGLNGVSEPGMGFLPIIIGGIAITAVAAATASIAYWITENNKLQKQIDYTMTLERQGVPPALAEKQAHDLVSSSSGGLFSGLTGTIKWVLIGGMIIVVAPPLLKMFNRR